jgi:hypothetical protein
VRRERCVGVAVGCASEKAVIQGRAAVIDDIDDVEHDTSSFEIAMQKHLGAIGR